MFYAQSAKSGIFFALVLFCTYGISFAEAPVRTPTKGLEYFDQEKYDEAIAEFTKAIELAPQDVDSLLDRAAAYVAKGDFDRAIADYKKAIEMRPEQAESIEVDPNYASACISRGDTYYEKGDFDRAIADYSHAIKSEFDLFDAYAGRAKSYFRKKQYDQAWADVHAIEGLGGAVSADFLAQLKQASKREK